MSISTATHRRTCAGIWLGCSSRPQQAIRDGRRVISPSARVSKDCPDLPASLARKLPRYPVPVALIGRLAVDSEFQGKGLGAILLADACRKVVQVSAVLAVAGIIVDARDAFAARFYAHFGFVPMPGLSSRLLLPAKALPA